MNNQLALIISSDAHPGRESLCAIETHVRLSGLIASTVPESEAVEHIKALTASSKEPSVILIGPTVTHALIIARRIREVWPIGQMLFVPDSAHFEKLRQQLRHAPLIGPNWALVEADQSTLPQQIRKAAYSTQQRLRLRTTIDRANLKISSSKPVDSIDYRRLVISEHYLANLLAQSQEAIVSLDNRLTILYWSSGAERLFGKNASAVYGMTIQKLPIWCEELRECLEKIRAGADSLTSEISCSLPSGNKDLEILFSGVHDDTGNLIGTSLALRDISLRNQMLDAERRARIEAERMSRMKDEFLAILSHELRTPLSAIIGRTQLLQMRHRNEPELLAALGIIERNAQLQAKLIEDLLDVSAIITGKLRLDRQAVAAQPLVEAAVESIRLEAERKQLELVKTLHPVHGVIYGDPQRLQQILFNLLGNAVKFTHQGGRIEVTLSERESRVEICISDNGQGIHRDFLPHVFDRFGQEDSSTTRRHGGLGLGLSIAKQLVQIHGGDIRAASAGPGCGTTFTVSLPLHLGAQLPSEKSSRAAHAPGSQDKPILSGRRILVVDDVADARQLVTDVLKSFGAEVFAADSGAAALEMLNTFQPDVLVSDIGMPEMDGYELIKKIRARGSPADKLPALALTAFASKADREKALHAGFQMHVVKPLVIEELTTAVARLAAAKS